MTAFTDYLHRNIEQLDQGTLAITRAHGAHHPEVFEVRRLYQTIRGRVAAAGGARPAVGDEFAQLRRITGDYTIPGDGCPTLEMTYLMLQNAHRLYDSERSTGENTPGRNDSM